jgi:hypothetical protein
VGISGRNGLVSTSGDQRGTREAGGTAKDGTPGYLPAQPARQLIKSCVVQRSLPGVLVLAAYFSASTTAIMP